MYAPHSRQALWSDGLVCGAFLQQREGDEMFHLMTPQGRDESSAKACAKTPKSNDMGRLLLVCIAVLLLVRLFVMAISQLGI